MGDKTFQGWNVPGVRVSHPEKLFCRSGQSFLPFRILGFTWAPNIGLTYLTFPRTMTDP